MKLLFVTRKYPPIKGGMERWSYDLYEALKNKTNVTLLANTKGNKFLPFFLIQVFFYLLFNAHKYTNIYFGDALLAPLAVLAKNISKAKITIATHALDVIYPNIVYQKIVLAALRKADKITCMSNFTLNVCINRGIPKQKCVFIPNGIDFTHLQDTTIKISELIAKYNIPINKIILLSTSRLVKRKGHEWFVSNVMPKLPPEYVYIIAGDGPEKKNIEAAIQNNNLLNRILMTGKISDNEKICFYKHSYLSIMPNIKVHGDAEGFGTALIDAASYGLPSIASKIEGITDAVIDGKTGYLVEARHADSFVNRIISMNLEKDQVLKECIDNYNWDDLIDRYIEALK